MIYIISSENKNKHDSLISTANEYFEKLIPYLQDKYNLRLEKPHISCSSKDYIGGSNPFEVHLAKFIGIEGESKGLVKICDEGLEDSFDMARVIANMLGHVAVHKNSNNYRLFKENELFHILEDGIANRYERDGLRFLKQEFGVCQFLKYCWVVHGPNSVGENFIYHLFNWDAGLRDVVLSPDVYKERLEKDCKKMLSLWNRNKLSFMSSRD